MKTIEITIERFEELLKKECIYDIVKNKLQKDFDNDEYVSSDDKMLFGLENNEPRNCKDDSEAVDDDF